MEPLVLAVLVALCNVAALPTLVRDPVLTIGVTVLATMHPVDFLRGPVGTSKAPTLATLQVSNDFQIFSLPVTAQ